MNKIEINGHSHVRYDRETYELEEATRRASAFYEWLDTRRTVREISSRPVSKALISQLIMAGSSAPSGAHKQPWTFCAVSNQEIKKAMMAKDSERLSTLRLLKSAIGYV